MVEVLKKRILSHLKHREYKPVKSSELAKSLGVKPNEIQAFKKAFQQLQADGQVVIGPKTFVTLPPLSGKIYGIFRGTTKGFGFVTPIESKSHADLFIPADYIADAMNGDTVAAVITKQTHRGTEIRFRGKIIEIVQRANNHFVGTIIKTCPPGRKGDSYYLQPDGKFTELVEIDDIGAKNAQPGDKAVVEIITYASQNKPARGVIIELLGKSGSYKTEISATIHRFALPSQFDDACLNSASQAAAGFNPDDFSDRLDLTKKTIVTIDPEDAKDFDDAISLDENSDGTFTLGVHIADVSNFVKSGSPLDVEAKNRGNSTYLPGFVIPMLPEVLSNGVCSLQPNQPRLTKSVFITYDSSAKILKRDYADSIICSAARLTYTEADKILEGHKTDRPQEVVSLLRDMKKLAKRIELRRNSHGMLHLDLPEIELVFDKAGRVIDAHPADTSYPHTMIEMFMVEANEAVAELLNSKNIPFMRRIHPDPDSLSLKGLSQTLKMFGVSAPKNPDRFDLQDILSFIKDKPAAFAVNTYILRSLSRAEYSPLNIGHYALASKHYCHFTSPIRRYADLLIHRLFEMHIAGEKGEELTEPELVEIGKGLTFTEERSDDAEEDLKAVLILQLFQKRLGETMETVVSGLANFGIFVQCTKFGVEGLIPIDLLGKDRFIYDQRAQCVYGMNSGRTFHIGMPLTVKIVSVNLAARQLNVIPVEKFKNLEHKKEKKGKNRFRKRKK